MEKKSSKVLNIRPLSVIAEEAKDYIRKRANGEEKSLKVGSEKVNRAFMDGFDWNRIISIAGMPGSGKTTVARQWITEMIRLNPDEDIEVLSFQFEMLGTDEIAKDASSRMDKTIKQIYSADGKLGLEDLNKVNSVLDDLKEYPISVVDNAGTVDDIRDTILSFVQSKNILELNKGLIISLDHSLLVRPFDGDDDKTTIDKLMHLFIALKKYFNSIGIRSIFILLSQLNRNIESPDRVTNPRLHFPNKNDIFGASSVYYSSDYVIIIHRPALIDGIGHTYGTMGLPIFNPKNEKQPMIYLHIIKERFGSPAILMMVDDLKKSQVNDYTIN